MRCVIQRVSEASVTVNGDVAGKIRIGLLVYLGVDHDDRATDTTYLVDKVRHIRIFADESGQMNRDVVQAGGAVLLVSAFSLQADARKGRRPSFAAAASPEAARPVYEQFAERLTATGVPVELGRFGAMMEVYSVNDGPICILIESKRAF